MPSHIHNNIHIISNTRHSQPGRNFANFARPQLNTQIHRLLSVRRKVSRHIIIIAAVVRTASAVYRAWQASLSHRCNNKIIARSWLSVSHYHGSDIKIFVSMRQFGYTHEPFTQKRCSGELTIIQNQFFGFSHMCNFLLIPYCKLNRLLIDCTLLHAFTDYMDSAACRQRLHHIQVNCDRAQRDLVHGRRFTE